ncbi:MAG: DUF4192 family protein [Actinomycetales bacterium]|nr:DUF4192 family protein [Actinomycetales bacterium]
MSTSEVPASTRVNLCGPAQLVQAVPYLLGHAGLADDLVLICARAERHTLALRMDLAVLGHPGLWERISAPLDAAGADAVHLIAYPAAVDDAVLAGLHVLFALAALSCPPSLRIRRAVTAAAGAWWEHDLCAAAPAGPGRAVGEDAGTALSLGVALGVPARDRDQVLSTLDSHPGQVLARVAAAIEAFPTRTFAERRQVVTGALHRRVGRPVDFDVAEAAGVLEALGDVRVRDEALVAAHREHAAWTWPVLVPFAPPAWLAPVATLAAVAVHQRGNSVLAQAAIERALAVDAGYRMALLMRQVLDLGLTPGDVRRHVLEVAARELGTDPRP